jgi:hypothetical protein
MLPMSVVLVGVGKGDMSDMSILDADNKTLTHRGVRAKRDIVQFVGELISKILGLHFQTWKKHKSLSLRRPSFPLGLILKNLVMIDHKYYFKRKK